MIMVIGKTETILGFGLAGIDYIFEVKEDTKAEDILKEVEKVNPVLLIVDEYTYDKFEELFEKLKEKCVIIEVPCIGYKGKSFERLKRLIKEAFGMELQI